MTKKMRIEHTNTIVQVASAIDDKHCLAIAKLVEQLRQRYQFVILNENEPFSDLDQGYYPSSFVLCPTFTVDKSHHNWSKTRFHLYYVNATKLRRKEIVPSGSRQLLTYATPLKTKRMLELLLLVAEIEEAEDITYRGS